jgi:hypothetical protein
MPYRTITVRSEQGPTEAFRVRIPDAAVTAWLAERDRLRAHGYPDRPPDVDTPHLRAWLPCAGEERHPYFTNGLRPPRSADTVFPIFTATWHAPGAITTKVIVTGHGDGSIWSRVVIDYPSGERSVDQARRYGPDADPDTVWSEIELVLRAIDRAGVGWDAHSPMVADYPDFLALDRDVEIAEHEAWAAGLLAAAPVH